MVTGIWYKILVYGAQMLVLENNYQNMGLREWITFHVMIAWLLVCLDVSINYIVLYVINCRNIDMRRYCDQLWYVVTV